MTSPPERAARFGCSTTHVGVDGIVTVYRCELPDGTDEPGADSMRVGGDGKVVEWRSHY
jgi:hypothetical protein